MKLANASEFVGELSYNHLGVFGHTNALAFNDLNVVQATKDLVLDFELSAHGESGTLLDLERLVFEAVFASRGGEVNRNGIASGRIHGESLNDTDTRIVGVGNVFAIA